MKKQEIEFRVLDIIDRLEKGQPIEDDMVELKTEWPSDHFKAARRIAAHANCARGEPIMWLIGIDEKTGVVGADFEELSVWYAKIKSKFDQLLAPNLISLAVPYNGKTVVALVFETERAPFVIRIPATWGPVTYEVPWREANSTRSARRSDLIKILYPIQKQPSIEILNGSIELQKAISGMGQGAYQWNLNMMLYFITYSSETMVFPFHRCEVLWRPQGRPEEKAFSKVLPCKSRFASTQNFPRFTFFTKPLSTLDTSPKDKSDSIIFLCFKILISSTEIKETSISLL